MLIVAVLPGILFPSKKAADGRMVERSDSGEAVFTKLRFRMHLPEGWRQIPDSAIAERSRLIAHRVYALPVSYLAGFQAARRPWFRYPYALVQWHQADYLTWRSFAALVSGSPADSQN